MTTIAKRVSLAEQTVKKADQLAAEHRPAPTQQRRHVNAVAWSTAIQLAHGDASRIEVITPTQLIVK